MPEAESSGKGCSVADALFDVTTVLPSFSACDIANFESLPIRTTLFPTIQLNLRRISPRKVPYHANRLADRKYPSYFRVDCLTRRELRFKHQLGGREPERLNSTVSNFVIVLISTLCPLSLSLASVVVAGATVVA